MSYYYVIAAIFCILFLMFMGYLLGVDGTKYRYRQHMYRSIDDVMDTVDWHAKTCVDMYYRVSNPDDKISPKISRRTVRNEIIDLIEGMK